MTETKRDLNADLAVCDAATAEDWAYTEVQLLGVYNIRSSNGWHVAGAVMHESDATFITEARTGWPAAIRRAMDAESRLMAAESALTTTYHVMYSDEARVERIQQSALDAEREVARLRAVLSEIRDASTSQYAHFGGMAGSLKRMARNALYPGVTADAARKEAED